MRKVIVGAVLLLILVGLIIAGLTTNGMTNTLIKSYLINGTFILLKAILFGVALWTAFKVIDVYSRIDILEQLEAREVGAWIFLAALAIAIAMVINF